MGEAAKEKIMRMRHWVLLVILLGLSGMAMTARAQSAADTAAIKATALDYVEGWYEGNAERMERALHPDLAKRIVVKDPESGKDDLSQMSALWLVQRTRQGGGNKTPKDQQQKDITILDVYEDMASVKVVFQKWVDYVHMAKFDGRWVIVNVLWHLKPKTEQK
jgi:Putative lumazine-binding